MYGNRNPPETPPCDNCRVDILPENSDALKIYMITRNQYIMSFSGPVDINQLAVWEAIDRFNVKKPVEVFERVIRCARLMINDMVGKNKSEDE